MDDRSSSDLSEFSNYLKKLKNKEKSMGLMKKNFNKMDADTKHLTKKFVKQFYSETQ